MSDVCGKGGVWSGTGTFVDQFLGLVFCLGLCFMVTDLIKMMVGRPRPNYFSLRALVEYGDSDVYFLLASAEQVI